MTKCSNCGTDNPNSADFCAGCGTKIKKEEKNSTKSVTNYIKRGKDAYTDFYNKRSGKGKALTIFATCCIGLFIISLIGATFTPENNVTSLGIDDAQHDGPSAEHLNIDNNATEVIIKGYSNTGANVTFTATDLNVNNQTVDLSSTGQYANFSFKVTIPNTVNEITIRIYAKKEGKEGRYIDLTIKRNPPSSQPTNNNQNSAPATPTPQTVTISQLYSGSVSEGTLVKVSGKVVQSDGYNLRIENSNYKDILIQGTGLSAFEDQKVTVIGTYDGASSYTTVMGGERTVPTIKDAKIV